MGRLLTQSGPASGRCNQVWPRSVQGPGRRPMAADDEFLRATLPALDLVHSLARRFVLQRADAEDLVQETYLRAWQAWTSGRLPRRVEPWLATICLNVGRDWVRRSRSRR